MGTKRRKKRIVIDNFNFRPGRHLARKYEVISRVGAGWEGEVYMVRELRTGIVRAAKCFFPQRNLRNKTSKFYARKLHKLRQCPILVQYYTEEEILHRGARITILVSEYVEGELLKDFVERQPGKRLTAFQGLHLLHALANGIEDIHRMREYHGDLHSENVIVHRYGLGFDLKLLDLFHWDHPKQENIHDDVCDLVKLFYDAIGGKRFYARQPELVKEICCGLKRSLIIKKFKTAGQLREHLENLQWD